MKKSYKRGFTQASKGFTLIELLVVIAIIGILASIILASLATARSKGSDATVKSDMDSVRSQMELYASSNNNSYSGGCAASASSTPSGANTILSAATTQAATQVSGTALNVTFATAGDGAHVTCHDSAGSWAADAPLTGSVAGTPKMWCIDSNGSSKAEAAALAASITACS